MPVRTGLKLGTLQISDERGKGPQSLCLVSWILPVHSEQTSGLRDFCPKGLSPLLCPQAHPQHGKESHTLTLRPGFRRKGR